jgi:hypothetical protein
VTSVLLANIDYQRHMTSEGDQFQEGLRAAGWTLCGVGYDGLTDVRDILARYRPARVVVHDPRDWDPESPIAFRRDVGFSGLEALRTWRGHVAVVVKDAATFLGYQQRWCETVGARAAIVYYHPTSVLRHARWLADVPLVRTYHTVDADAVPPVTDAPRQRALVSGAVGQCYRLRQRVVADARHLGVSVLRHPGYGNFGSLTDIYLQTLATYKVSIATSSVFGFALRKIVEGVACGCTVITDLPDYDRLPGIDGALVRVPNGIHLRDLRHAIDAAEQAWTPAQAQRWAEVARVTYDYRAMGAALDRHLQPVGVAA